MYKRHEKSKSESKPDLLKNVFYHASAPTAYPPQDFGVSEEQSNLIIDRRRQFENRQFNALIAAADTPQTSQPTLVNSATKAYAAMAVRELLGDHLKSYAYLCESLYLLHNLPPEEKRIEYCVRFEVNIGVQIAIVLRSLSDDTYYPKMIAKAAAELAPDLKMGNWTAWLAWAEYEVNDDERANVPVEETNQKIHRILMSAKKKDPSVFWREINLQDYLKSSYHFSQYRQSLLYKELLET